MRKKHRSHSKHSKPVVEHRISGPVFVEFHNPQTARKEILLGAVEIISILKNYEFFKKIRTVKRRQILEMKKILTSTNTEINHLKHLLPPVTPDHDLEVKDPIEEAEEKEIFMPKEKTPRNVHIEERPNIRNVRKLEEELSKIRKKLDEV